MGYYVHLSVVFACDKNEPVAELAKKHLAILGERSDDGQREAVWFLTALAARTGGNPGPKGGLSLWGTVGNYTRPEIFVEVLSPFFRELLQEDEGGPLNFEHIIVFCEPEQREYAEAFEVFLSEPQEAADAKLIVKHHERLPFAWMQM